METNIKFSNEFSNGEYLKQEFESERVYNDFKGKLIQVPYYYVSQDDVEFALGSIDTFIREHYKDKPEMLEDYLSSKDTVPAELRDPDRAKDVVPAEMYSAWKIATMINQNNRSKSYVSEGFIDEFPTVQIKMFFGLEATGPFSSRPDSSWVTVDATGESEDIDRFTLKYIRPTKV